MKRALILSLALLFIGCKEKVMKIGLLVPLTGPTASYGREVIQGVELALTESAIDGVKIKYITYDNRGFTKDTKEGIEKFSQDPDYIAVIGPVTSKLAIVAAGVADKNKIPLITPTATHPLVTRDKQFVFRVCYTDPEQGKIMAKFTKKSLGLEKAAIFTEANNPYSEELSRQFSALYKQIGGEVVLADFYISTDTVFSEKLKKIAKSNPQVVFIPGYVEDVVGILRTAKEIGWTDVIFLGGDGWHSPVLIEKIGSLFDKGITAYLTSPFSTERKKGKTKEFVQKYKEKYGEEPEAVAALSYDAVSIVIQAIKELKEPSRKKVMQYISTLEGFEGVTGSISFKGQKDPLRDVYILKPTSKGFTLSLKVSHKEEMEEK